MKIDDFRNNFTLRTEPKIWAKFKWIASYNGRTLNQQLNVMIRDAVEDFEKKNGIIEQTADDQ